MTDDLTLEQREPLDLDAIEAKFWYRADDMNALIAECRALRAQVERQQTAQRRLQSERNACLDYIGRLESR